MNDHSQPDRWLDDELARYSTVEPRPGLEHRVLAHVRAESARRRKSWLRWAIIAPAAALLLFVIDYDIPRPSHTQPALAPPSRAVASPARKTLGAPRKSPSLVSARKREPLPRLAVFPSPEPLTPQEMLLFAALHDSPEVVAKLGVPPGPLQPPAPIEIQQLKFAPLDKTELPGGSK